MTRDARPLIRCGHAHAYLCWIENIACYALELEAYGALLLEFHHSNPALTIDCSITVPAVKLWHADQNALPGHVRTGMVTAAAERGTG